MRVTKSFNQCGNGGNVEMGSAFDNGHFPHIRYLEGKLIDQARRASRALVINNQNSSAKLPESDREDMKVFLEKIYQLLPVLGVELLVIAASKAKADAEKKMLYCEIKGLKAQ